MNAAECPSVDQISKYAAGQLPGDIAAELEQHVSVCAACAETFHGFDDESDPLLSLLKRPESSEQAAYLEEPAYQTAVSSASQLDVSSVASLSDAPSSDERPHGLDLIGQRFGQYELLELIGRGGMGMVYRARHLKLDRSVAFKVLPHPVADGDQTVQRFEREMQAVGRLQHPNIVQAFDADEVDGIHFLAMEYVDGVNLSELLKRHGPLPVPEACELIRQAAIGLQHAFEHGLVHRDVKPGNLMLNRLGTVKLLDLGLALLQGNPLADTGELTGTGQLMGTVDYMAPEQAENTHDVDIRADIYSLGATLYALLTGSAPFAGRRYDTLLKKLTALATESAAPIRDTHPDVPRELAAIVDRMLLREPAKRFSEPREVVAALSPFAELVNLKDLISLNQASDVQSPSFEDTAPVSADLIGDTSVSRDGTERPTDANVRQQPVVKPAFRQRRRVVFVASGVIAITVLAVIVACFPGRLRPRSSEEADKNEGVTATNPDEELTDNWIALFDGTDTSSWSDLGTFEVRNGELVGSPGQLARTRNAYGNFELEFDWRISEGGNGGVFYRERGAGLSQKDGGGTEFQLLDNGGHSNGRKPKTRAGALYAVVGADVDVTRPIGEFNTSRVVCRDARVEHWLNGTMLFNYDLDSDDFRKALAEATPKYRQFAGAERCGHIYLQCDIGTVAFRSIRICEKRLGTRLSPEELASWVFTRGGGIDVNSAGRSEVIWGDNKSQLPAAPFQITGIRFDSGGSDQDGITDEDLMRFGERPELETLYLMGVHNQITDLGLRHITGYSQLKSLNLKTKGVLTEASLRLLGQLSNLTGLFMYAEKVDVNSSWLEVLMEMPHLERLELSPQFIVDQSGIERISKLTNLKELILTGHIVSEDSLRHLAALKQLEELTLRVAVPTPALSRLRTDLPALSSLSVIVTDSCLTEIGQFTNLRTLNITGTGASDTGLLPLQGLTNLRHLDIQGDGFTPEGVAALQTMLPECSITARNILDQN